MEDHIVIFLCIVNNHNSGTAKFFFAKSKAY